MERAYEAGAGQELKEEDRDNSIFVSAFKRHLQSGSLKERLDTLLTDAAAGQYFCDEARSMLDSPKNLGMVEISVWK